MRAYAYVGPEEIRLRVAPAGLGFCPEPACWGALAAALDRAGIPPPGRFTTEVIFRRCPDGLERNLVEDDWYTCAICEAELPPDWNF